MSVMTNKRTVFKLETVTIPRDESETKMLMLCNGCRKQKYCSKPCTAMKKIIKEKEKKQR